MAGHDIPVYGYSEPFKCVKAPKMATSGRAVTAFRQAEKLKKRHGVPIEDKVAAYEKAAKLGHPDALEQMLAVYYANNDPVVIKLRPKPITEFSMTNIIKEEFDKGVVLSKTRKYDAEISALKLRISKESKNVDHFAQIAQMKLDGKELQKDKKKAFDYLMYASQQGSLAAQERLGDFYFYELGEYEKGVEALQCAASQGSVTAQQQLAVGASVFEDNHPKTLSYHMKAGAKGSLKSITFLRSVFRDGTMGYEKDKELADCFDQFIKEYSLNPKGIYGLEWACPLPEHPDLKFGDQPLTKEKKSDIAKVERKFNPDKQLTEDELYVFEQARKEKLLQSQKNKGRQRLNRPRF